MTTIFDDLPEVMRRVEKDRSERDQAQGALNQILKEIRQKFGCKNLTEAKGKREEEMDEVLATLKVYNIKWAKAKKRWPHLFPS